MSNVTEQLVAWEAKAKAVASAPWHRCACGHCTIVWAADRETCIYSGTNDDEVPAEPHAGQIANADFMAAASEAMLPIIAEVRAHRNALKPWAEDGDGEIPEDTAINAAFPTRSGRHDIYGEAMRLVSAKRSKGALVALVNWLLHKAEVKS